MKLNTRRGLVRENSLGMRLVIKVVTRRSLVKESKGLVRESSHETEFPKRKWSRAEV